MDRRRFLIASGASGAAVFAAYLLPGPGLAAAAGRYEPVIWYAIDQTGIVTVHVMKAEVGQHIGTAFAMLIADELEVDWHDVRLDYPDPRRDFGILVTAGSWSVAANYEDMRRYGAAGRLALVKAGAKRLGVPYDECRASNGRVEHPGSGRRASYAELVAARAVDRVFGEADLGEIKLKSDRELRIIGSSPPALDIPVKVDGRARFGIDCAAPGMLYAKIVRPPRRADGVPRHIDDAAAQGIAGYRGHVSAKDPTSENDHYVIALATDYPAALAAAKALKVDWDLKASRAPSDAQLRDRARALIAEPTGGAPWWIVGDAAKAIATAHATMTAEYTTAHVAHAGIEPMAALVLHDGERWHAYAGSAFQTHAVASLAAALAADSDEISLHQTYLGDPSGRRVETDALVACALAAKAAGKPVKLIYDGDESLTFDFPRPLTLQRLTAALDGTGGVTAIRHDICSAWPLARALPITLQPGADHQTKVDWSVVTGADSWYSVPNYHVRAVQNDLAQEAAPSGFLRGNATGFTFWALESFIDELAHRTGQDAVTLRLTWLDGREPNAGGPPSAVGGASRLAKVIAQAVEITGYADRRRARQPGRGIGLAASSAPDRQQPSWTVGVAEVAVDDKTGAVRVERLTIVSDIGTAVHGDGALAQIESAALTGLSVALLEELPLVDGAFKAPGSGYRVLRYDDVPDLDIHLVTGGEHPTGAGEPAMSVVAPAIGNAIFDAVGARVRDLPITPAKILAALKNK